MSRTNVKVVDSKWWKVWRPSFTRWQIKAFLVLTGLAIIAGVLLYTKGIVDQLIEQEEKTVRIYAETYRQILSGNSDPKELDFLQTRVIPTIHFPLVMTDEHDNANRPYSDYSLNVEFPEDTSEVVRDQFMQTTVRLMKRGYPAIEITDESGKILQKVYYSNSSLVTSLRYLPLVEIAIVGAFLFIAYAAFSSFKRHEETSIWVGMSKEAAHQLGTPLSSLLAWIELLRSNARDNPSVLSTADEMEHDIERLNVIAVRFSKIGSVPELTEQDLVPLISDVSDYFRRRLPHLGKKISLETVLPDRMMVRINSELVAWVFENLIKNAVDAIEMSREGNITITAEATETGYKIFCTDTGKGMSSAIRKQVFQTGFTTKKRGWGLGLSLARRIIQDYHQGKIYVAHTQPGKGSCFAIELSRSSR